MIQDLLIGTGNKGKFGELKQGLFKVDLEIKSIWDLQLPNEVEETGFTYEENAKIKVDYFFDLVKGQLPVLAEDSGVEVEALKGELGIYSRRWGKGEHATDEEWIKYFLERMEGEKNRRAKFVCCAILKLQEGKTYIFNGEAKGVITNELEFKILPGLPLSSCFKPDGFEKVYAEMTKEEKAEISHRGSAMKKVGEWMLFQDNQ